ncbi:2-amino-3,7-dideoxy-D-threo-hept-6-ulosonate synthase [Vallitalea guaymasensis]|uniref:2-amino-3,7-dideoxy-D-threo-hept-6-ulosonate synthase n=1 Tax=Vallitalea guaymasensis TaxID=1185412 RepID=UPI000DE26A8A|nr:2-amino-3,7-dideoxy-D-threo-hept-6-ulosonate synthase [Vallitalea guaymasensis]
MYGKIKRLNKLFDTRSNHTIIVPMDHGATVGPIKGLDSLGETINQLENKFVNGVVLCKGQLNDIDIIKNCHVPIIVHLSNSSLLSPSTNFKTLVGSVEEAIAIGADAISVHINLGADNEHTMLYDVGKVADACFRWGMPLLVMTYVRGNKVQENPDSIKLAARVAQEIGADIVKVNYTGDIESFQEVVSGVSIPVVAAGGGYDDPIGVLQTVNDIMTAGASGISFGRKVFQSTNPTKITEALSMIVHKTHSLEEAIGHIQLSDSYVEATTSFRFSHKCS